MKLFDMKTKEIKAKALKNHNRKLLRTSAVNSTVAILLSFVFVTSSFLAFGTSSYAAEDLFISAGISPYLNISQVFDSSVTRQEENTSLDINEKMLMEKERLGEHLAMANVQQSLNIRAEADEKSARVGMLYKDCGGTILERADGWIKIKSGAVIGWAKEEFLLTGDEAMAMAVEVGYWLATINAAAVRVREEPDKNADILGYIVYEDGISIIEVISDDWISVAYGDVVGYVATDYVSVKYHIDEAETIEAVLKREAEEAERRRTANRGRLDATADEVRLLGALIYCEAGNQSYEGKVAVGAVVMNRVRHRAFPNTIHGVIYASGQFPPALNGKVARIYESGVPASCLRAAQAALDGETTVGGALYFRRAGNRAGYVLGDHVFW
jgi:SH3-like domain-containing protein